MSDKQTINNNHQAGLFNEQRLVEELESYWQNVNGLLPGELRLLSLSDRYRTMAIRAVAEYITISMTMHLLHTAAIFYQQAEEESIDTKEREATLQDVEAEVSSMMGLNQRLSVHTYKDLLKLAAITVSVQGLGESDTAEDAQYWLYNLPTIYSGRLEREHLIHPIETQHEL